MNYFIEKYLLDKILKEYDLLRRENQKYSNSIEHYKYLNNFHFLSEYNIDDLQILESELLRLGYTSLMNEKTDITQKFNSMKITSSGIRFIRRGGFRVKLIWNFLVLLIPLLTFIFSVLTYFQN